MSHDTSKEKDGAAKRREEIFTLQNQLKKEYINDDDGEGSIITSFLLQSTLVPAMKDLLKEHDVSNFLEERKDDRLEAKATDSPGSDSVKYTVAVLECLVSFVAFTCANPEQPVTPSVSAKSRSYNSLSFKRKTTPLKSKSDTKQPSALIRSDPKEDKAFFVTCGAFEMAVYMLRKVLEDHTSRVSSSSWSKHKHADLLDSFDSIGVADSIANVQIESTLPSNDIPRLVLQIIACLAHNASDALKNDRILPILTSIVHQSMMVFLPCPYVQTWGCWILYSLSNPLLQELIAAGSVSILVNAMKCHPTVEGVQEHGNKALYQLLPLLIVCYKNNVSASESTRSASSFATENELSERSPSPTMPIAPSIEIDGKQLQDYSSLLPSLPSIVLRGMEEHSKHPLIQQYGLLVLTKLCKQDQETYEIVVSEGGLNALLNVINMTTTDTTTSSYFDDDDGNDENDDDENNPSTIPISNLGSTISTAEQHDCLAQMACQFLRDLSRPTNSSMDILRIVAVKGGTQSVLRLLDYYNRDLRGANNNEFAVNIIDPAMACLRNLMTNEDNRSEIMTLSKTANARKDTDTNDSSFVHIVPIVLDTLKHYPLDAAIQAYGCDLLGRLAMAEDSARLELVHTTIYNAVESPATREYSNHSRLWKKSSPQKRSSMGGEMESTSDDLHPSPSEEDAEVVDLSEPISNLSVEANTTVRGSNRNNQRPKVDAFVTTIGAMQSHKIHMGVQERAIVLLLAMIIDRDAYLANPEKNLTASTYLVQRLQEVYASVRKEDEPPTLLGFLKQASVSQKGVDRWRTLVQIIDDYERKAKRGVHVTDDPNLSEHANGGVGKFFARRWSKLSGGTTAGGS